jgi:hypothetical protein
MMSGSTLGEFHMKSIDTVLELKQRICKHIGEDWHDEWESFCRYDTKAQKQTNRKCNLLHGEVMLQNNMALGELGQGILKLSAVLTDFSDRCTRLKEVMALSRRLDNVRVRHYHSDVSLENWLLAVRAYELECNQLGSEKRQQIRKRRIPYQQLEVEKLMTARCRSDEKLFAKHRTPGGQASGKLKRYSVRKR